MQDRNRRTRRIFHYAIAIVVFVVSSLIPGLFAGEVEIRLPKPLDTQRFGSAVAVSGDIIVVGAPGITEDAVGRAFVFRRNGGTFERVAELVPTTSFAKDRFGAAVAIQGSTVVVSSTPSLNASGSAYIFKRPSEGWSGVVSASAKLSPSSVNFGFGEAVDIDLRIANAVCGMPPRLRAFVVVSSTSFGGTPGAVYLYIEPPCGWEGELVETAKLVSTSPIREIGATVAIGGGTIATGRPDPTRSSWVHVFTQPLTGWSGTHYESATLVLTAGEFPPRGFGGLDVSADGTRIAVSSTISKRVFLYEETNSGWSGEVEPVAELKREIDDVGGGLGGSLSMESNGDELIVRGATNTNTGGIPRGQVYKFERPAGGWTGIVTESGIFPHSSPATGAYPGAVATDAGISVVGDSFDGPCCGNDRGAAFAYLNDEDSDRVPDVVDNCPAISNRDQSDVDNDELGDACDPDADGDGLENDNDNAPVNFNPDQSDLDGDGVGDVADPCPSDLGNTCDPNGSAANSIGTGGGEVATTDGSVSITVPSGALSGDTSISITNTGDGFTLTTNSGEAFAVFGVDFGPGGTVFGSPISVIFAWDDADNNGVVDGTNLEERSLVITKDGVEITGECQVDPNCDQAANTFLFTVNGFSEFTLAGPLDSDSDGVPDDFEGVIDICPATDIPEAAPTSNRGLGKNRWALTVENSTDFTQAPPQEGAMFSFTTADTRGCSCSQIVEAAGIGNNHLKRGCSTSVMLDWINNP